MSEPRADGASAIARTLERLADAWNRGDADDYGAVFTADASYTTFVGTVYRGRDDIIRSHRALFAKFLKGTRLVGETDDPRFYGPDTAVVTGRGDTAKKKTSRKPTKVQTTVLVREPDGEWRIAAFHNTQRQPLKEGISFRFAPETKPSLNG